MLRMPFRFRPGTNVALDVTVAGLVCLRQGVGSWIVVTMGVTTRKGA
jgi:hypothetical protein